MKPTKNPTKLLVIGVLASSALIGCTPKRTAVQPTTTTSVETQAVAPAPPPPPAAPAEERSTSTGAQILQTGTRITVRTIDPISTESSRAGSQFESAIASSIRDAGGNELVPVGTRVFGTIIEARDGGPIKKPRLEISLSSIELPGHRVQVATNSAGAEGAHGGALKKIGAGTLIGAAAGGAGAGAAIGGAVSLIQGGKSIVIQPGTLVEFALTQPASLKR